jgi:hypothetical protein
MSAEDTESSSEDEDGANSSLWDKALDVGLELFDLF